MIRSQEGPWDDERGTKGSSAQRRAGPSSEPVTGPGTPRRTYGRGGASSGWFEIRQLGRGLFLVAEPTLVNSYLVVGRDGCVLIDSGLGIGNIHAAVEPLAGTEPTVINTHHHFDHVGGDAQFANVAIHELGAARLSTGPPDSWIRLFAEYLESVYPAFVQYRRLDDDFFHLLTDVAIPRPLPHGFDLDQWEIAPCTPSRTLAEGDVFDLGDRLLRVLHTPGHTSDSICLFEEVEGVLFCGDTVNTGPILATMPDSDLQSFANSTRRLADGVSSEARAVLMSHASRYRAEPDFLRIVADAFEATIDGDVPLQRVPNPLGGLALQSRFDGFSILVPAEEE
jgi:glyoxylase-like metal-dependent hydrolase (beta-lactamase superfamily II)